MRRQGELISQVDADLAEFFRKPVPKIQERMRNSQKALATMWERHEGTNDEFYQDNEEYLFDLATFNLAPGYFQDRISQLVNIRNQKILDIGCGIGTVVFIMAGQGNEVIGWDINKRCIDFCEFKKKKYDLEGEFTLEQPDYSEFDLIVAVDVLEHIDNLQEFIYTLGKSMKRGAKFYHSDFFPKGVEDNIVWPMHFEENEKHLEKWFKKGGLVSWDKRWAIKS